MGYIELGHTKKVLRFNKKAEAKVMENYFVYLYKDEQKKLVLERFSPMNWYFVTKIVLTYCEKTLF